MNCPPLPLARTLRTLVGTVNMHTVVLGEGATNLPTFVLVHGLGMSGRYMMPTANLLAVHGTVYVPDLPGFGRSDKPRQPLAISELADALAGWMESHGITNSIVIGNSLGAQVIVDFAVRHPGRLQRAVLVAPTIDPAARRISTQMLRLLTDVWREPASLYGIGAMDYIRSGLRRCVRTLRGALTDPIVEKLPLMRCPVLIIRGELDPIVPQTWVERAAQLIPEGRLVVIPAAAHAVNFNSPDALVGEVMNFLPEK